MSASVVIVMTGVLVASACALLGVFLVLRRMAMMADAISHAILPGLVAGYVVAQGPDLLAGFAGAVLAAVVTVSLVEWLQNTRRMSGESAIGIIFPAMFAFGTLVVSRSFANVHLDADAILYGNIEFTPFDALYVGETNLGPQSLWVMAGLCLLNLLFVGLFYKELKLATFDAGLSAALGFSPVLIHYAFMTILSITTVGAFTAVGAILVVALLIVPAAAAYLLTDRLPRMIGLAVAIGAFSAVAGYGAAIALDVSVAGAMATAAGLCFGAAFFFSPRQGLAVKAWQLRRRRVRFAANTLVVHLLNHERAADAAVESQVAHLGSELRWSEEFAGRVLAHATRADLVRRLDGRLELSERGRAAARQLMDGGLGTVSSQVGTAGHTRGVTTG